MGRDWQDALENYFVDGRSTQLLAPLYEAVAYVDFMHRGRVVFRLRRMVRVIPFVLSFVDQFARALEAPRTTWPVSDGAVLFSILVDNDMAGLRKETEIIEIPVIHIRNALRVVLRDLRQDIQGLPAHDGMAPLVKQLELADALLLRSMATHAQRPVFRRRHLHSPPDLDVSFETPVFDGAAPTRRERVETVLADAGGEEIAPVVSVRQLQFLELKHTYEQHYPSTSARDVFFVNDTEVALVFDDRVQVIDAFSGRFYLVETGGEQTQGRPRRLNGVILLPHTDAVYAMHGEPVGNEMSVLQGVRDPAEVEALVGSVNEVLAYLRDETIYDAPTGAALLTEVSQIFPRCDPHANVVGWYALDRQRQSIWWDGEGEPQRFYTGTESIVSLASTRHGLLLLSQSAKRPVIRWLRSEGDIGWERSFEPRGGEGYSSYKFQVWPALDTPDTLTFALISGAIWWAFQVHTRTRLVNFVLQHRETAAVRLDRGENVLVVASGDRLRIYPLAGRMPLPLWEERLPNELGLLAPVFPMHVQGDLLAHATGIAVVRDLETGQALAEYRGMWTAIFSLRVDREFGVTIIGANPGEAIEVYRADAVHWLGVLPPLEPVND